MSVGDGFPAGAPAGPWEGGVPQQPQKMGEIESEFQMTEELLNQLSNQVGRLQGVLQPVLTPPPPTGVGDSDDKTVPHVRSPMADRLAKINDQLRSQLYRVTSFADDAAL